MEVPVEMSVPCLKLEDLLHAAMNHLISHQSYSDAIFLGERICGSFASETATKLLSNAYAAKAQATGLAIGMKPQALGVLLKYRTAISSPINRYLHAKLLFDDGKLSDAEATLSDGLGGAAFDEANVIQRFGESAAFAFALSAAICERTGRFDEAMRFSSTALRLNPFLWTTFRAICRLSHLVGADVSTVNNASMRTESNLYTSVDRSPLHNDSRADTDADAPSPSQSAAHVGLYDDLVDSLRNVVSTVLDEQRNAHLNDASAIIRWPFNLSVARTPSLSPSPHRLVVTLPFTCASASTPPPSGTSAAESSAMQRALCVFGASGLLQPASAAAACWRYLVSELTQPLSNTDASTAAASSTTQFGNASEPKVDDVGAQLPSKRRAVCTPDTQSLVQPNSSEQPPPQPAEKSPTTASQTNVHSTQPNAPHITVVNATKKLASRKPRVETPASSVDEPSASVRTIVTRAATMRSANVKENKVQPTSGSAPVSVATRLRAVGTTGSGSTTTATTTSTQAQQHSTANVPAKRTKPSRSAHDKDAGGTRHAPLLRSGRVVSTRRDGGEREALVNETSSSTNALSVAQQSVPVAKAAIGDVTNTPPSTSMLSRAAGVVNAVGIGVGKHVFPVPTDLSAANANSSSSPNSVSTATRRSNRTRSTAVNSPGSGSSSSAGREAAVTSPQQTMAVAATQNAAITLSSPPAAPGSHDHSAWSSRQITSAAADGHGHNSGWTTTATTTDIDNDRLCVESVAAIIELRLAQLSASWRRAVEVEASKLGTFCTVLKTMARAYGALNAFRCSETLALIDTLPAAERRSRFALKRVALAHFESREFARACDAFEQLRREFPFSVCGLDTYSTALWYVQKGASLSALAQQLLASHPHAPQTWVSLANCFSLQRDAERTLTFLERSLRLKERAYTHALVGHELLNQGESTRARNAFARAIELDPRCYSALFGLGMLHLRADELAQAERCMRRAMRVTPHNSIVVCHLGVILHAQRRYDDALRLLRAAIELNPRDTMSRFHYASILFSLARYEEARQELENVKQVVPNEPIVFYLLSKVYRKLQRVELAQLHVTWALDLDPKRTRRDLHEVCRKQFLFAGIGERDDAPHADADSDDSEAELLAGGPATSASVMHAPLRTGSLLNQSETISTSIVHSAIADASASLSAAEQLHLGDASPGLLATSLPFAFPLPTSSTFHLSMSASTSPTPNETDSDA